jgi:hypothetical protein
VYASAAPLPDAPATLVIGRLARPYPSGTFPRRIALTSPSARRLRRNPHAERIDEEIKALNEGKKEVFSEAKGEGFNVKVLKEILRLRQHDKDERDEWQSRCWPKAPPS